MTKTRTRPRPNPKDEAARQNDDHGSRPMDGYAWQRWAREQTIPVNIARACKVEPQTAKFVWTLLSTYVGIDYLDSDLFFTYLVPSPRSWEQDDRQVLCMITTAGEPLRGSVKDSKR